MGHRNQAFLRFTDSPGTKAGKRMDRDLSNKIIGGCRLEKLLGKGGMGTVYKARHLNLDIDIAVKFLDKDLASSQELIERFIFEARAAARLNNPYIVRVYQVAEEGGFYFIQMEFVEGESLAQKLKRESPLALGLSLLYLYQITLGLVAAHQANIIHRDIKPENILISSKENVLKITDFGLAKCLQCTSHLTQSGQILGTPYYLSPEQCEGKNIDARSDIYSLGVSFFYMLTGNLPFQGTTPIATAVARLKNDPPLPRTFRPDIPEELQKLTLKMMARLPDDRYPNSPALLQDIIQLLPRYANDVNLPNANIASFPFLAYAGNVASAAALQQPATEKSNPRLASEPNHQTKNALKREKPRQETPDDSKEVSPEAPTDEVALGAATDEVSTVNKTLVMGSSSSQKPSEAPPEPMADDDDDDDTGEVGASMKPLQTKELNTGRREEKKSLETQRREENRRPKRSRKLRWLCDFIVAGILLGVPAITMQQYYLPYLQTLRNKITLLAQEAGSPAAVSEQRQYEEVLASFSHATVPVIEENIHKFVTAYPQTHYQKLLVELLQQKKVAVGYQETPKSPETGKDNKEPGDVKIPPEVPEPEVNEADLLNTQSVLWRKFSGFIEQQKYMEAFQFLEQRSKYWPKARNRMRESPSVQGAIQQMLQTHIDKMEGFLKTGEYKAAHKALQHLEKLEESMRLIANQFARKRAKRAIEKANADFKKMPPFEEK